MVANGIEAETPPKELGAGQDKVTSPLKSTIVDEVPTIPNGRSKPPPSEYVAKARDTTSQLLQFLSTASNETLSACVVGLGATTYFILGRVGLLLIGIVGGVILHAAWEDSSSHVEGDGDGAKEARKRREKSLDIVRRVLDLKRVDHTREIDEDEEDTRKEITRKDLDFTGFPRDTKNALEDLTAAIIRDYICWWYRPLLPDDISFAQSCRQTLNRFLLSISSHLSRKRPADAFLDFLTNSSSIIIVFLGELSGALAASRGIDPQDAISKYLEENPAGSLASVLDAKQQSGKLTAVAQDILHTFLEANAIACDPVRTFLQQILAGLVLNMTVTSCSRAYFINDWIIYALEEGDTTELVQAIDASVNSATSNGVVKKAAASADEAIAASPTSAESAAPDSPEAKAEHKRTVSRAEEAMEAAMQEAQRMNEMIAAEEAKRTHAFEQSSSIDVASQKYMNGTAEPLAASPTAIQTRNPPERPTSTSLASEGSTFKSFDQILASQQPTALRSDTSIARSSPPLQLTLHNATIAIFDDSVPGEKGNIRTKPAAEYLLQIEPPTSHFPGWMIARKYSDFETLHEVLKRIAVISGVAAFAERHQSMPGWKNKTKNSLRTELEKYLQDALSYQRLAECEGMKRFLEKDQHLGKTSPGAKPGSFGFPSPAAFETMGKGMLDVLTSAPKGAATGGKAIVGGMTGVLGGVGSALGQKKQNPKGLAEKATTPSSTAASEMSAASSSQPSLSRTSLDIDAYSQGASRESIHVLDNEHANAENTPSPSQRESSESTESHAQSRAGEMPARVSQSRATSVSGFQDTPIEGRNLENGHTGLHLPPPPSEISDDYTSNHLDSPKMSLENIASPPPPPPEKPKRPPPTALTIQETTVAVELFFATVNELYTLSSAWTLRLTLLNTAKTFLLRPGNANLEAIRQLLQTTIIDANISDTGIATHINKIRENALPTEEELKAWPPPPNAEEQERKRVKARKLLVEKGMPQALTSVMGQAASGEALGNVFDCLQVPEVARGLVFALVLQAVRALTQ